MTSFITALAQHFRETYHLSVVHRDAEMLVTVRLDKGREQRVKLVTMACEHRDIEYVVLRLQTRVCLASNHKIVQRALQANASSEPYAFALDVLSEPPVIDLLFHCRARVDGIHDIYGAMMQIAERADAIERKVSPEDVF